MLASMLEEAQAVIIQDDEFVIEFEEELVLTRDDKLAKSRLAAGAWMKDISEEFRMSFAPSDPAYY
jgi:hypothetical protein